MCWPAGCTGEALGEGPPGLPGLGNLLPCTRPARHPLPAQGFLPAQPLATMPVLTLVPLPGPQGASPHSDTFPQGQETVTFSLKPSLLSLVEVQRPHPSDPVSGSTHQQGGPGRAAVTAGRSGTAGCHG